MRSILSYLLKIVCNVCLSNSGDMFVALIVRSTSVDLANLIVSSILVLSNRVNAICMHGSGLCTEVDWFIRLNASSFEDRCTNKYCLPGICPCGSCCMIQIFHNIDLPIGFFSVVTSLWVTYSD